MSLAVDFVFVVLRGEIGHRECRFELRDLCRMRGGHIGFAM